VPDSIRPPDDGQPAVWHCIPWYDLPAFSPFRQVSRTATAGWPQDEQTYPAGGDAGGGLASWTARLNGPGRGGPDRPSGAGTPDDAAGTGRTVNDEVSSRQALQDGQTMTFFISTSF
jgi:hypothetical protein